MACLNAFQQPPSWLNCSLSQLKEEGEKGAKTPGVLCSYQTFQVEHSIAGQLTEDLLIQ